MVCHALNIPFGGPIQGATKMEQPGNQTMLRMEIEFMQSARGLASALHAILTARQLKIGVQLKAASAAQEIGDGHPS